MMFLSSIKVKSDKKFSFEEIDRETGAAYFKVEDFKNKYEKKTLTDVMARKRKVQFY